MNRAVSMIVSPRSAAVLLILLCVAAFFATRTRMDTRLEQLLDPTHDQAQLYDHLVSTYGSDEYVIVALAGRPLFDYDALDAMLPVLDQLEAIPGVEHVTGLPQIFRDQFGAEDAEALEQEMRATPFYQGLFINASATIAGIMIETDGLTAAGEKEAFAARLLEAVAPLREAGFTVHVVGGAIFDTELNALSMRESLFFFPLAAVASLLILLLLLRSLRASLVVVCCGAAAILFVIGLIAATGQPLNIVTSAIPLILWVLAVANCIHIVARFQAYFSAGQSRAEAVRLAIREVALPNAAAAVTTAVGFLSLTTANVPPIRALGAWMGLGMIVALVVNLVLGATLLRIFHARGARWMRPKSGEAFRALGRATARAPWTITGIFAVLVLLGLFSLTKIRPENETISFLPPESPLVESYRFVGQELTGLYTMDVLVDTPGGWLNDAYWPQIDALAEQIAHLPGVGRVLTPLEFLRQLRYWDAGRDPVAYALPQDGAEARRLLDQLPPGDRDHLARMVRHDAQEIRLNVLISTTRSDEFLALHDAVLARAAELAPPLAAVVTGRAPQMQHMEQELVTSQIRSFGSAFLIILICLALTFRSLPLLLVSLPPNLLPVLMVFAIMAAFAIPLDAGTVMVASIAIGIAVDDTIHLITAYARQRRFRAPLKALEDALHDVGPSAIVMTFTTCAGFLALGLSEFKPLRYFGLLSASGLLLALLADLLLTPALLTLMERRGRHQPPRDN